MNTRKLIDELPAHVWAHRAVIKPDVVAGVTPAGEVGIFRFGPNIYGNRTITAGVSLDADMSRALTAFLDAHVPTPKNAR